MLKHLFVLFQRSIVVILCLFLFHVGLSAQTTVDSITTTSSSCNLQIPGCNGDSLLIFPSNTTDFTSFQWYYGSVAPGNEINGPDAAKGVVSVSNDSLVSTGNSAFGTAVTHTYILTGNYTVAPGNCPALNDTIIVEYQAVPALATTPDTICSAAGDSTNLALRVTDANAVAGTMKWFPTLADLLANTNELTSTMVSPSATTTYYVSKTGSGSAACSDIDSVQIVVSCLSIGNIVWYDTDNDGLKEVGEAPIPGVTVQLFHDADNNGTIDGTETTPVASDVTDASGLYLFEGLAEGKYVVGIPAAQFGTSGALNNLYSSQTTRADNGTITETAANNADTNASDTDDNGTATPAGFLPGGVVSSIVNLTYLSEPTSENPDNSTTVADNNDNLTVDFGFYGMSIGSLVFMDVNNNGTFDAGDMGLSGVTVKLYSDDGTTVIATTTTDADGQYLFANLLEGSYIVGVVTPAGKSSSDDIASSTTPSSVDNDDNGTSTIGAETWSAKVVLSPSTPITGESDQAETTTTGLGSPGVRDNPLTPDGNSNMRIDFGFKGDCPTISNPIATQTICQNETGGTAGADLTVNTSQNAASSIRFVRFDAPQTGNAMYTGGTDLDVVTPTGALAPYTATLAFDPADFQNTSNTTADTFYVYAVLDPAPADPTCRPAQQIMVIVNPLPLASPASLTLCESTTGSGTATFTLSGADATVLNGQTTTVTYHDSAADAASGTAAITTKDASSGTLVYARVQTAAGCYATSAVTLNVNLRPQFTLSLPPTCPGDAPTVLITLGANADVNPTVAVNAGTGFAFSTLSPTGVLTTAEGLTLGSSNTVVLTNANTCTSTLSITPPVIAGKVCLPVQVVRLN